MPQALLPKRGLQEYGRPFSRRGLLQPLCRAGAEGGWPFIQFVRRCRLGDCTGISFVESTTLRMCRVMSHSQIIIIGEYGRLDREERVERLHDEATRRTQPQER